MIICMILMQTSLMHRLRSRQQAEPFCPLRGYETEEERDDDDLQHTGIGYRLNKVLGKMLTVVSMNGGFFLPRSSALPLERVPTRSR